MKKNIRKKKVLLSILILIITCHLFLSEYYVFLQKYRLELDYNEAKKIVEDYGGTYIKETNGYSKYSEGSYFQMTIFEYIQLKYNERDLRTNTSINSKLPIR